ncbi:SpaA isopeptide-forming pilin-related protein [Flavonifractor plautii]|uniref:Predicted outer membrane protein n=1 Tax=Flavonifractor plautii TaxID=292800 RepID=A0A174DA31_FLAPL|nr:SpaA isopeptide-forming pilin-related protein [Flavonifractor plautii]ERI75958.1 putative Cna protein B-type domain protein [Clostridium sp. ATCC BAA-442]MDB7904051.1 SpaA isopeptide-forming pilin-related protein [Flavonifractor plautii]CUO22097.1 Predicted outer membrane protein [Flavonifractor plautii]
MKKRLISMLLALLAVMGLLPTAAFAASTPEEALGEVQIYNGGVEMSYLSINGRIRSQIYTYYNYDNGSGSTREIPAYCVNPNTLGVPQTVGVGESIEYLADEKASDPKVVGIVANGYPTRSLAELGLENKYQGYYATKMALWCYLLSNWDINNLKVNPNLTGVELQRAQKILAAAKDIYARGTAWNEMLSPEVTCTPDRDTAYEVTIDGKQYKQQVFTFWSKTWVCDYSVNVAFSVPDDVPDGTRIVDMNNQDITTITTEGTGDGYAGKFKILYPLESVQGKTGSVQLSFNTNVYKYAVFFAICQEKDEYGELQNYVVDTDPTTTMQLSAYSNYSDGTTIEYETGLRIIKYETGTEIPISGALFEVIGPDGDSVGTFVTNGDGRIEIPLKKSGNYTVVEREAPQHYMISEEPAQNVTVVYDEVAEVTFFNDPYGTLRIEKKSNTGMNLPGAVIAVEHIESGQTFTATTSSAGVAIFDAIPLGAYRIQEKTAPVGWQLDDTVYTATVVAGETTTIPIINEELPGLRIIKYDRKNMVAMPNVTFAVYRDGEFLGNFKTDQFGEILIADAEPGTYRAFEVDTGDEGHILDTTPQEVELHAGDGIKELMFFNDMKPGLKLIKVDSDDPSKVIPNAVFEIKSVEGTYGPQEFRTDQSGEIDLSMLPAGSYVVTEKSCDGYIIDETQRIIELKPNEDAQFVFTNHVKPSLQLIKLSSDGSRLAGVTFRIARIEDGSHYLDRTTNSNGEILISDLEPGVYSVRELSSVQDHIPDDTEHHVELFPGQTSTITLTNDKRPNLYIHKTDADTGEPIEHTVYLVKGADGHSIAEVETDENGVAVVENLLPGVVEIIEKSVPEPYLLAEESQMVTLLPNRDRDVYFQNYKRPTIEIIKENSITHDRIENVPFQVWYASNNTATGEYNDLGVFYTDEEGRIVLSDPDLSLRDGWFRVKELEPAPGFALADPDTQEAFIAAGEGHTFRFLNRPLSAISVWKYDSETGAAIEGAVFQVRYLSGNTSGTGGTVIGTYRTSVNGSFTVTGCKAGTYIIEELSSDGSHVIDTPPQTVYLSGKDQEVVQVYFGNSPKGSLLIKKVSSADNSPISDVQFFVTESDGTVVGDSNGYFVTDSAGTILIEGIDPGTTLVVKETRAKDGFILDDTPQTAQIQAGQTVTLEFRNQPTGQLIIHKLSGNDKKTPLEGVQFKITYSDGSFVDADSGQLSSNGLYWTNSEGQIILSGLTGTVVVTEVESIPGYTIDPNTQSQTVVINPNDTQELYFYNNPIGGIEIIKVNASKTSERIPDTTFEIRRMDDALVDTITTDKNGRAYLALEDGSYYAIEIEANPDFVLDDTPHYFEVKDGKVTTLRVTNAAASGILIHKVDTSGEGIYGVKFLLYDEDRNPIGEFTSDDDGYVYITADDLPDGANTSGRFYLRELEAAEGYILDKEYKTVYVRPGRTAEIEWVNEAITGQIQIYKYAAEANSVTGVPAGTPLQGAVYEIINERSGRVVDYITTDARGVAASKPLPLTRYKIREVTAPAYFQLDPTVHDVTLEYAGQIIKIAAYDKPANLKVTVTKTGNKQLLAGDSMRYDLTVANNSNVPLENFYLHDRFPTDCATAKTITTGTYNTRLNYQITYKTNYNDYRVLATNLLSTNNYAFDLSAISLMQDEVVTDVRLEFGKVPAGFASVVKPTVTIQTSANLANGYQVVNRADAGGQYMSQWETGRAA